MSIFALHRKLASFLLLLLGTQAAFAQTPPPVPAASDEPELVEFDTSKTRSIAVLKVTHDPKAAAIAPRQVVFHDGRIIADGAAAPPGVPS